MGSLTNHKYCCTCKAWVPQSTKIVGICGKRNEQKQNDEVCPIWKSIDEKVVPIDKHSNVFYAGYGEL